MRTQVWLVEGKDARPAGLPDECFYCKMKMGSEHKTGCVIRCRTVVIEARVRLVQSVPEDWSSDQIEFHLNESSWCASSVLNDIKKLR